MSTISREWLQQKIADMEATRDEIPFGLDEDDSNTLAALRIALASLEAEVVADEHYKNLNELYHAQEKRLFKLAQRIKGASFDKYAHSPSQAIDVLESAIFGERADDACRAAMLQGAERAESPTTMQTVPALDSSPKISESPSGNSPVIPDGLRLALSNAGIAAPESDEMLAATCEKYIQELVTWVKDRKPFRSAVILDGWLACSERIPERGVDVLACTISQIGGFEKIEAAQWHGGMKGEQPVFITSADAIEPTHWMPLPAAPQQEAK